MLNDSNISDEVRNFVKKIIRKHGMPDTAEINYKVNKGSTQGYNSKTIEIDISDSTISLHVFVKEPLKYTLDEDVIFKKLTLNEIYFYVTIYPEYQEFLNTGGIKNFFGNVPECYNISDRLIAFENLKLKGFKIFGQYGEMNEDHIIATMKTLGKFHAISYAFKDQKKELYDIFVKNIHICLGDIYRVNEFDKLIEVHMEKFLKSLDPVRDKNLLEVTTRLKQTLTNALLDVDHYVTDYSVIIHGDCWCNNIMYLYDDTQRSPADVMLLDWQLLRHGSPAVDLSYFFYGASSESTIENLEYYLKLYYDELSKNIRKLGSDPEYLYPYRIFKEEWIKFAKYSFAMAIVIIRGLLQKDEVINLDEYVENANKTANSMVENVKSMPGMKNEHLLFARLKNILKHFVKHDLL